MVAGVRVLDLRSGRRRGGGHRREIVGADRPQSLRSAPWKRPICSRTSPPGCRRWRSPASGRSPTCRRRTTGSGATWPSTSGSPSGSAAPRSPTSPAARATARTCSPSAPPRWSASTPTRRRTSTPGSATGDPNLRFERTLVERFDEPCDAIVFLQTIEHVDDPGALLARFSELAPAAYVSTPNRLTLAPRGGGEVRQPVAPARVHRRRVPRAGRTALRLGRALRPLSRRQAARPRAGAEGGLGSRPPGAAAHRALLRLVRARDRRLGLRASTRGQLRPRPGARLHRRLPLMSERAGGGGPCARPPQPHALRRGLRHLSVRRGVAVRRGDPLLRAGLRAWPSG